MIDISEIPVFKKHISTLKETSKDFHERNQEIFLIESQQQAINFDEVKNEYITGLNLVKTPCSVDSVFMDENGKMFFVEFKNAHIGKKEEFPIRKKIYDSVMIFTDIVSCTISDLRNSAEYILVYSEDKNQSDAPKSEKENCSSCVQDSNSFNQIASGFAKLAHEEYVRFGIDIFKNYCFKDVHTYTEKEFERFLSRNKVTA